MLKVTGEQLYIKLVDEYKIIGEKGVINFSFKNLTISVESKDTVGNLQQEWLNAWMKIENIDFEENTNSQTFPDFHLDGENKKKELLEEIPMLIDFASN